MIKGLFPSNFIKQDKASLVLNGQEVEKVNKKRVLREGDYRFRKYPERGQMNATNEIISYSQRGRLLLPDQNSARASKHQIKNGLAKNS